MKLYTLFIGISISLAMTDATSLENADTTFCARMITVISISGLPLYSAAIAATCTSFEAGVLYT